MSRYPYPKVRFCRYNLPPTRLDCTGFGPLQNAVALTSLSVAQKWIAFREESASDEVLFYNYMEARIYN